ncbi:MAG TPA: hypothetical protein VK570_01085, partial [Rubrivivax sp.]|nr:hypothetical protein [Rubrivivax sp.]
MPNALKTLTNFTAVLAIALLALLGSAQVSAARDSHQRDGAQTQQPRAKFARDLTEHLHNAGRGIVARVADRKQHRPWQREVGGRQQLQVIVTSNSPDHDLRDLRSAVLKLGGSVHARHPLVHGLTVQIPVDRLDELAERADVEAVTPNRAVQRSASALESTTGTTSGAVKARIYITTNTY